MLIMSRHVSKFCISQEFCAREVLEDQHRMMYYTVTISTIPGVKKSAVSVRKTSTLRWQYASTLSKTQVDFTKTVIKL